MGGAFALFFLTLIGCTAAPPPREPAYLAAYRTRDFASVIAITDPPTTAEARLIRGMALYNEKRLDESETTLAPLLNATDGEVRGLANATSGLIAHAKNDPDIARARLVVATNALSGLEQTRARRFLASIAGEGGAAVFGDGRFTVQIGAFSTSARAERSARAAAEQGWPGPIDIVVNDRGASPIYAVTVGRFGSRDEAQRLADRLGGFVREPG